MVEPRTFEPVMPPRSPLPDLRPRGAGEIIGASFKVYGAAWRVLLPVAAVFMVPYAFVSALVSSAMFRALPPDFLTDPEAMPDPEVMFDAFARVLPFLALLALFALFLPVMLGGLAWAVARTYLGETPTPGQVLRFAFSRFGALLWVVFLTFLVFAVLFLVTIPLMVLLDNWFLVFLLFVVLFVALFVLFIRLTFAPIAVVVEDVRGTAALGRSWELVGGYFWKVLGTLLLGLIIVAIAEAAVSAPVNFSAQALLTGDGFLAGTLLTFIAGVISGVVIQPFSAVVQTLLYFDLRIRKESFGQTPPGATPGTLGDPVPGAAGAAAVWATPHAPAGVPAPPAPEAGPAAPPSAPPPGPLPAPDASAAPTEAGPPPPQDGGENPPAPPA